MYNIPHTFTLDRIITYLSLLYVKSYTSSKFQLIYDFFKDQISNFHNAAICQTSTQQRERERERERENIYLYTYHTYTCILWLWYIGVLIQTMIQTLLYFIPFFFSVFFLCTFFSNFALLSYTVHFVLSLSFFFTE